MSAVIRLALADPNDSTRESLKGTLMGMESFWLEAECSRYEYFIDVVRESNPDIGILCFDGNPELALDITKKLAVECPDTAILAVATSTDGQLILSSIRAGAKEFLPLPTTAEELESAADRITQGRLTSGEQRSKPCEVITVCGATGGVGSTSIAVNIGCILAEDPKNSVVVVDLDLALGDADVFLDSIPEYTLADVCQNVVRLDMQLLKRSLTKHVSGLYLLPRPVELQDALTITPEGMNKVIGLLRASFTHVIIDTSKAFTEVDLVALRLATHALLVTQLDLPCLRNVVRLLMSFEEIDDLRSKTEIVVNRTGLDSGQISLKKAKETLGWELFGLLPNDYKTMVEVRNNGVPLNIQAPKAAITVALRELLTRLMGNVAGSGSNGDDEKVVPTASGWRKFWPGNKV